MATSQATPDRVCFVANAHPRLRSETSGGAGLGREVGCGLTVRSRSTICALDHFTSITEFAQAKLASDGMNVGDNTVSALLSECGQSSLVCLPAFALIRSTVMRVASLLCLTVVSVACGGKVIVTDSASAPATDSASGTPACHGTWTFAPQVTYAVGSDPVSIAAGDFNGDGYPDLAVLNAITDYTISLLFNAGNGTFARQVTYAAGDYYPGFMTSGDINGDGRPDLVLANSSPFISVWINKGHGTFEPPATYPVAFEDSAIAVGDFNGDGSLDLAVTNAEPTNYATSTIGILYNAGSGTFGARITAATGPTIDVMAVGDFNGDGRLDLAVGYYSAIGILLQADDGTFASPVTYDAGVWHDSIAVADFNGDGRLDLATTNYSDNTVSVLLNAGSGTLDAAATYVTGATPGVVAVGDFNGDGYRDLAVTSGSTVSVLLNAGSGTFAAPVTYAVGAGAGFLAIADYNRDGVDDIAVANNADNTVSILLSVCH